MRFNDNCIEYVPGALPHTLKYLVYNNCQTRKPIDEDEDDADEDEDADYDAIPNELDEWKEWSEKRSDVEYLEGLRRQIVDTYNGSREAVGAVIKVIDKQISKLNKP